MIIINPEIIETKITYNNINIYFTKEIQDIRNVIQIIEKTFSLFKEKKIIIDFSKSINDIFISHIKYKKYLLSAFKTTRKDGTGGIHFYKQKTIMVFLNNPTNYYKNITKILTHELCHSIDYNNITPDAKKFFYNIFDITNNLRLNCKKILDMKYNKPSHNINDTLEFSSILIIQYLLSQKISHNNKKILSKLEKYFNTFSQYINQKTLDDIKLKIENYISLCKYKKQKPSISHLSIKKIFKSNISQLVKEQYSHYSQNNNILLPLTNNDSIKLLLTNIITSFLKSISSLNLDSLIFYLFTEINTTISENISPINKIKKIYAIINSTFPTNYSKTDNKENFAEVLSEFITQPHNVSYFDRYRTIYTLRMSNSKQKIFYEYINRLLLPALSPSLSSPSLLH